MLPSKPEDVPTTSAINRGISDLDQTRWLGLLAGTAAVRTFIQHPLIIAMARKQTTRETPSSIAVLKTMFHENGIRGMWRGYPIAAAGMVISEVCFMFIMENMREAFTKANISPILSDGVAGATSDLLTTFLQVPFLVIANRQMTAGSGLATHLKYCSAMANVRAVHAEHGGRGFIAGLGTSLWLAPHSGFWWALYGVTKEKLYLASAPVLEYAQEHYGDRLHHLLVSKDDNIVVNSFSGFVSSVVVMTAYNPVIVVRTRLQVIDTSKLEGKSRYIVREVIRDLYRHEGWRGFYKGLVLNVSTSSFDGLLFALMYELTKQYSDKTKD